MGANTVVLADDHPLIRKGLRALLEMDTRLTVVAEASDGLEAINLVDMHQPDLLVVDMMMPNVGGLEVVRQARDRSPKTRALILSMCGTEQHVVEALRCGAYAYVLKDRPDEELQQAVDHALLGKRYLSPALAQFAFEACSRDSGESTGDPFESLTTREREVLYLSSQGKTHAQIAEKLFISARTVEAHRANLMRKLGFDTQTDLIFYAIKRGILTVD